MRIVVAPDSFKESLSANEVALSIEKGIHKVFPEAEVTLIPMADGGEGTVQSLVDATGGKVVTLTVKDPLMRDIEGFLGILGDKETAVIEMAAASGLDLLKEQEKDPWVTTTYGTGQLIKKALDSGSKKIIIGIGGSATNDGGAGMAEALGVKLLDSQGNQIIRGGGGLKELMAIDSSGLDPGISRAQILVACDVNNPLVGENGASQVYGPQKGADKKKVGALDENLKHFASIIKRDLDKDILEVPGSGAAGGLGGGLMAFLDAQLKPGFEIIKEIVDLEQKMKGADLVITGEGRIDFQTQFGKTPFGVAQVAGKFGIPVIALAGTLGDGHQVLYEQGIDVMFSILDRPMDLTEAKTEAPLLLKNTAERIMRLYRTPPKGIRG